MFSRTSFLFRKTAAFIGLMAALLLAGCFHSQELSRTRAAVERAVPEAHFEREFVLSLGPRSLGTLGWLTAGAFPKEVRSYGRYLFDLDRLKVGVYHAREVEADSAPLPNLSYLIRSGWETLLRSQDEGEWTWILYRERRRQVRDLYVATFDAEELVLVRFQGRLDRLLAHTLAEHGVHFDLEDTGQAEVDTSEVRK